MPRQRNILNLQRFSSSYRQIANEVIDIQSTPISLLAKENVLLLEHHLQLTPSPFCLWSGHMAPPVALGAQLSCCSLYLHAHRFLGAFGL